MSAPITILCIEDETPVREAILRDLQPFADHFDIEEAQDVPDARQLIQEILDQGNQIGLILCDHIMPGQSGVDLLIELNNDKKTRPIRKVLLTGQAGQADTINAINNADLHHYLTKPWTPQNLHAVVKEQLTDYIRQNNHDPIPDLQILDAPRLLNKLSHHPQ